MKIVFGLLLPVASGAAALVALRKRVALGAWRGNVLIYGPFIGVTVTLAVFVILVAMSISSGH